MNWKSFEFITIWTKMTFFEWEKKTNQTKEFLRNKKETTIQSVNFSAPKEKKHTFHSFLLPIVYMKKENFQRKKKSNYVFEEKKKRIGKLSRKKRKNNSTANSCKTNRLRYSIIHSSYFFYFKTQWKQIRNICKYKNLKRKKVKKWMLLMKIPKCLFLFINL